jgi:predicted HTH transcriptional regulator
VVFLGPGEHILDLIPEEGITDLRVLGLNERQIKALRLMVNEGRTMTASQYVQLFGVNRRTAQRDLSSLVARGQAKRIGQGVAVIYQSA